MSVIIVLFEVLPITIVNTGMAVAAEVSPSLRSAATTTTAAVIPKAANGVKSPYIMAICYGAKDSDEHTISAAYVSALHVSRRNNKNPADDVIPDKKFSSSFYKSKRFVYVSLRMEEGLFKALQTEAQRREISFNSLVNKTLKNYITSEMYFEQLGFILVSKDFLRKTFLKLDEKYIEEFGREIGFTVAKEYISHFHGQVNTSTLIEFLDIWFRRFQFFQHRIEQEEQEDIIVGSSADHEAIIIGEKKQQQQKQQQQVHTFMVIHDINMNFSLVLRSMLEGLVEPITKSPVIFRDITSSSIIFLVKVKSKPT